jgi:hypothetical protein
MPEIKISMFAQIWYKNDLLKTPEHMPHKNSEAILLNAFQLIFDCIKFPKFLCSELKGHKARIKTW